MSERTYRPPEINLSRLEIRDPITQGRLAWGYISEDESLIMSDKGDVWVRHGPEEVFGSKDAVEEFVRERKFKPPPDKLSVSPYDLVPFKEHLCRVIANKPLHTSRSSRLVIWMLCSKIYEDFF